MTGHAAILDMCCGSRMFWFDKNDDRAIFSDIRKEEHTLCDGRRLIITKGYPKRDDFSRRIDVPYNGYEIKTITHPHFGDKPVKVFAIKVNING